MTWASLRAMVATFAIGLTAGIAPFLFMQLLPAMLNPQADSVSPTYWPIVLTGVMVGVITAIVFGGKSAHAEPREIFFHALGVPAILVATTTNVIAANTTAQTRTGASEAVAEPKSDTTHHEPRLLTRPASGRTRGQHTVWHWKNANFSADQAEDGQARVIYFVVLGEYASSAAAWENYEKFQGRTLRAERYVVKKLGVYEVGSDSYILAYSSYTVEADAIRTYQLLKINDPQLRVKILTYTPSPS